MRNSYEGEVPCGNGQRKKGLSSRFSLRRLIYSSPILGRRTRRNSSGSSKSHRNTGKDAPDGKSELPRDLERGPQASASNTHAQAEIHKATSKTSVFTASTKSGEGTALSMECPLCLAELSPEEFCELNGCGHKSCLNCLQQYLRVEITESRVCISCPECAEPMHPNEIRSILDDPILFEKYEDFMVRRVLAVDPDTRYCPAPDCGFAVIASECASCPKIKCERPGCNSYFCYHCKAEWHPNQTCDAARAQRSPHMRSSSITYSQDSHRDDVKPCPRCQILIAKMDDGSCNHILCTLCGAEFCWLCLKEVSDLHYLSPSGCTFWGKKPWSRKKKILWQLGTLVGAPVGIALVAGITVPAMIIGIPVWVGRKLFTRYKSSNKHKRNTAIIGGVALSILVSPLLAGLAVGIGVPILLFYVYGVVPVSLCRSGGCGGSNSSDNDTAYSMGKGGDNTSMDAASTRVVNPSIGEASLSLASGSQVLREVDRESASTVALAGSLGPTTQKLEVQADLVSTQRLSISSLSESVNASMDDGAASTRALAGSMLNYKTNGSDACSCIMSGEDCSISDKSRGDDTSSLLTCGVHDGDTKTRKQSQTKSVRLYDNISNDSIFVEIAAPIEEKTPRFSTTAALRRQFLSAMSEMDPATDQECKIVIQVSNDTDTKPIIHEEKISTETPSNLQTFDTSHIVVDTVEPAHCSDNENSKL